MREWMQIVFFKFKAEISQNIDDKNIVLRLNTFWTDLIKKRDKIL